MSVAMAAALRPCPSRITCCRASSNLRWSRWKPLLPLQQWSTTMRKISHHILAHKGDADQPVNDPDPEEAMPADSIDKRWEELSKFPRPPDMPFREDINTIDGYWDKLGGTVSLFYYDGRLLSRYLCWCARVAVILASNIVDCAALKLDTPSEFSQHTTKLTLQMYVKILVSTAEDSYHKKVQMETIVSYLGALQGVAAISHIMVKDTLVNCIGLAGNTTGDDKESLSIKVDRALLEYQLEMNNLKDKFSAAKPLEAYKLLKPLLTDTLGSTVRCVLTMTSTCKWVLHGHVPGKGDSTSRPAPDDSGEAGK